MELFDTTQSLLGSALLGASQRQSVLANNLANVETPGFKRSDVDFHGTLRTVMATGGSPENVGFSPQVAGGGAARADGNTVDADVEAANLAKNGLEYEAISSVLRARIDILESAMGAK